MFSSWADSEASQAKVQEDGRKNCAQLACLAFEIRRRLESIKLGKEVSAASGFVRFGQIVGYGIGRSHKLPPDRLTWDARQPARTRFEL
jgi:hypothetical protein